ncbi:hypothetical protein EG329_008797 [Mollisiaceae sp. DMI_Dod_QoI]|nr:hypothetical protein EG329_008797 [Helotiales sp. DMI_Dod_QoI]
MSTQASSSSAPPPPIAGSSTAPPSLSPTLPSSTSSQSHPSPPMTSSSQHSPETRRQIAEARAALEASMSNIGSNLDHTLRSRAENLHSNSKQLERQQKDVVTATSNLRKESTKLQKLADEGSKKIKELGNVQNWAEMLERDFLVLGETLRLANLPSDEEWETSDGEGSSMSESDDEERMKRFVYGEHKFVPEESPAIDSPAIESPRVDSPRVDAEGDTMMMMEDIDGTGLQAQVQKPVVEAISKQSLPESIDKGNMIEDTTREDKGKGKAVEIIQHTANTELHSTQPSNNELTGTDQTSAEHISTEHTGAQNSNNENANTEHEQQHEMVGGSSTATTGSTSDPSSSSVHTSSASVGS